MNRNEFLKSCGYVCLGFAGFATTMESCTTIKLIQTTSENRILRISKAEFSEENHSKIKTRKYILVKTSELDFPIVLYRFSDSDFSALLLKCPHQGSELNVNGDLLTCPAHGSEFNNKGKIIQGPADKMLQSYTVSSDIHTIYIHLA
jgi:Rieske Fe-S protein